MGNGNFPFFSLSCELCPYGKREFPEKMKRFPHVFPLSCFCCPPSGLGGSGMILRGRFPPGIWGSGTARGKDLLKMTKTPSEKLELMPWMCKIQSEGAWMLLLRILSCAQAPHSSAPTQFSHYSNFFLRFPAKLCKIRRIPVPKIRELP